MSAYGKVNKTEFGLELIRVFVKLTVSRAARLRECPLRELPLQFACGWVNPRCFSKFRGGGCSWEFLLGGCRSVLQILTLFRTKKCHSSHPFSDLASNKLFHHYLDYNKNKKDFLKSISNSHISLFFYLIWNWNNEYVYTFLRVPSRTVPDFRPKWAKSIPTFRPKRPKNPTLWGGTYIYGFYKGVPCPPGSKGVR